MKLGSARAAILCGAAVFVASVGVAAEAQEVVVSFGPPDTTDTGVWFKDDVRPGGTAGTEDLTGLGGDLENAPAAADRCGEAHDRRDQRGKGRGRGDRRLRHAPGHSRQPAARLRLPQGVQSRPESGRRALDQAHFPQSRVRRSGERRGLLRDAGLRAYLEPARFRGIIRRRAARHVDSPSRSTMSTACSGGPAALASPTAPAARRSGPSLIGPTYSPPTSGIPS